jgi:UDP-N-acetylglucosamine 2-epimerase (non-hydrolysing)
VVRALREAGARFAVRVCLSGQHGALARDIAREVGLSVDFDLGARDGEVATPPEPGASSLSTSLARLLERLSALIGRVEPAGVLVQGDTTTALAGALAAFHAGVPCFHVEAGLRTANPRRPFPEEMNRRLLTRLSALHFAPTEHARQNLLAEGVAGDDIVLTGNTVVDGLARFVPGDAESTGAASGRPTVLVTLHRREGAASARTIAHAVLDLASVADVVWIRHPNPTSAEALAAVDGDPRVQVLDPQPYAAFVALMRRARVILTDSGGVQEEAPVLGVPVVVLRDETDRPEAVAAGNAVVVGGDASAIVGACRELLDDPELHGRRSRATSPFGDGAASPRIAAAIAAYFDARR